MVKKRKILLILTACFILTAAIGAGFLYIMNMNPQTDTGRGDEVFVVEKGETLFDIAKRLEDKELIRSAFLMRAWSKLQHTGSSFKSGQYNISSDMTMTDIHNRLVMGSGILLKVTVPEGITLSKIASILGNDEIVSAEDFLKAASSEEIMKKYAMPGKNTEGFLFPDSYLFQKGVSAEKVLETMIENFFEKLRIVCPDYEKLSMEELYDKVILASVIEREYRVPEEAPLIASVFYNRLENKIPLSSCATIEYVLTEIFGKPHPEYLTYKDLESDSEYNTYRHAGLPPGPIANPGLTSLKAAFSPAQTDYLYFLLKNKETGEHYFSKRYSEHNKAKVLYLKTK